MRIHRQKLEQIHKKGGTEGSQGPPIAKKKDAKVVVQELRRLNQMKQQNQAFNQNEKNIGISRENQILLSKLVEISTGKKSSIPKLPKLKQARIAKNASISALTNDYRPTSLNMGLRQRETERVEAENHAIARRLFESKPMIKKKMFDKEYADNKKYKKNCMKVPKVGKITTRSVSVAQLRPLESSATHKMRRPSPFTQSIDVVGNA